MDSTGYAKLEKNLIDILKEQQMKLGYCDEEVRLYYPLSSLNHFFGTDYSAEAMLDRLQSEKQPDEFKEKLGAVEVTQHNGRFCFLISKEGGRYVHENITPDSFLGELIAYVGGHDCTMQGIFDLFRKYSKGVVMRRLRMMSLTTLCILDIQTMILPIQPVMSTITASRTKAAT